MSKISRKHRRHGAFQGKRMPQTQGRTESAGDADSYREMKAISRLRLRLIWEKAQLGGTLNEEDMRTVQAMREHPEYATLWPRLDAISDAELEQDGINPILHIMIHTTTENQLVANDPPVTGEVLAALMAQGITRHEAMHRIGAVLTEEIFAIMKSNGSFDASGFERKLRALIREAR
jgi:hypothetical protein